MSLWSDGGLTVAMHDPNIIPGEWLLLITCNKLQTIYFSHTKTSRRQNEIKGRKRPFINTNK
ncbi:MAG: hypothetical protein COC09_07760 [Gammaproteobacteria bacterium]|nr:MAG: hypothetical protein COC09_07760 [Gammaproteobacteria bacterium]